MHADDAHKLAEQHFATLVAALEAGRSDALVRYLETASRRAASERAARDQPRRECERMFWEQKLRPALLPAIAERAKQPKTITRSLITAVLETLTMRDNDLTT